MNVTPISELKDIDALEMGDFIDDDHFSSTHFNANTNNGLGMIPSEHSERMQKFIRQQHIPTEYSGMRNSNHGNPYSYIEDDKMYHRSNIQMPTMIEQSNMKNSHNYSPNQNVDNLNCREIAEHIKSCPVCSKIYNKDPTIYIVIIIILIISIILLLRKLLQ